ncbi:MAG: hypothetical protein M1834_007043 [Cirrosporium novae-zelandiae]|nr:MAG: hypothetical protein M1834_007043 [Cirrosporium novae-zelandiae]
MTVHPSTLSSRGRELAAHSIRDLFRTVMSSPYDPDTNPDGFINMGTAENYSMLQDVTDFVDSQFKLTATNFTYGEGPWGTARLRKAMANHMHRQFPTYKPLDPENILFASGVTGICQMLGFSIANEGDGILFSRPVYQAFRHDFSTLPKVVQVFTSFNGANQFDTHAVDAYEKALLNAQKQGITVRGMVLCNPHNPLGKCYPKESIISIMKFCSEYKIHLIVDEIYSLSVYDIQDPEAVKFTSALSFDSTEYIDKEYLHVMYGMSKDTASGGLRLGCIYTENKELLDAMGTISNFHWSGSANELSATLMLENQKWMDDFLKTSRERLAARNKLARKILDDAGIHYAKGANSGFFLWLDLRGFLPPPEDSIKPQDNWKGEETLVKRMVANKVYLCDGHCQSAEEAGWFRVIFSHEERALKEGLKRYNILQPKSTHLLTLKLRENKLQPPLTLQTTHPSIIDFLNTSTDLFTTEPDTTDPILRNLRRQSEESERSQGSLYTSLGLASPSPIDIPVINPHSSSHSIAELSNSTLLEAPLTLQNAIGQTGPGLRSLEHASIEDLSPSPQLNALLSIDTSSLGISDALVVSLEALKAYILDLQQKAKTLENLGWQREPSRFQIIHRIKQGEKFQFYFDTPQWTIEENDSKALRGGLPLLNVPSYLDKYPKVAFIVYRNYDVLAMRRDNSNDEESDIMLQVKHTAESLYHTTKDFTAAVTDFLKLDLDFSDVSGSSRSSKVLSAPYLVIYHTRNVIEQYLHTLPDQKRKQFQLLLDYVLSEYAEEYRTVDSLLGRGKITYLYIKYLFKLGEVLVEGKDQNVRGVFSESWLGYSPISRNQSSRNGSRMERYEIAAWPLEIDAHDLSEKSIDKLSLRLLKFVNEDVVDLLKRRGDTFWKCCIRNFVSYHEDKDREFHDSSDD